MAGIAQLQNVAALQHRPRPGGEIATGNGQVTDRARKRHNRPAKKMPDPDLNQDADALPARQGPRDIYRKDTLVAKVHGKAVKHSQSQAQPHKELTEDATTSNFVYQSGPAESLDISRSPELGTIVNGKEVSDSRPKVHIEGSQIREEPRESGKTSLSIHKPAKPRERQGNRHKMDPAAKSWDSPDLHGARGTESLSPDAFNLQHRTRGLTGWPVFPQIVQPVANRDPEIIDAIPYSPDYVADLLRLIQSVEELESSGYVFKNLDMHDIDAKRRCLMCHKMVRKMRKEGPKGNSSNTAPETIKTRAGTQEVKSTQHSVSASKLVPANGHPDADPPPPRNICNYHPGQIDRRRRIWTCCGSRSYSEPPCFGTLEHTAIEYAPGELEAFWLYHRTPLRMLGHDPALCTAVAIDCEMGITRDGETELIRVTVLDYFTGSPLIDSLVCPDVPIANYNTRYSGVSSAMMEAAKRENTCIFGRDRARLAIWKYVGPQTIVIGHSAYNDLKALRWIHESIVDTFLLEPKPDFPSSDKAGDKPRPTNPGPKSLLDAGDGDQGSSVKSKADPNKERPGSGPARTTDATQKAQNKAPKGSGPRSLKTLARVKLGREIQAAGRMGHDSFEDALAARDLVHWAVLDRRESQASRQDCSQTQF